jgi:hypothetical protein
MLFLPDFMPRQTVQRHVGIGYHKGSKLYLTVSGGTSWREPKALKRQNTRTAGHDPTIKFLFCMKRCIVYFGMPIFQAEGWNVKRRHCTTDHPHTTSWRCLLLLLLHCAIKEQFMPLLTFALSFAFRHEGNIGHEKWLDWKWDLEFSVQCLL